MNGDSYAQRHVAKSYVTLMRLFRSAFAFLLVVLHCLGKQEAKLSLG